MAETETVSLFTLWRSNRDELRSFGACCEMARSGQLPGLVPVEQGTSRVRLDHVTEALQAMRKAAP